MPLLAALLLLAFGLFGLIHWPSYALTIGAGKGISLTAGKSLEFSTETLLTDTTTRTEGAVPSMTNIGDTAVDDVFGTTIVKVTDTTTGADCHTPYSYYPALNLTNTLIYVQCGNAAVIYAFNSTTLLATDKQTLASPPTGNAQWYGMIWSGIDADVIYLQGGLKLWSYKVSTSTYTLVRDFTAEIAAKSATYLTQSSFSLDDNIFAATYENAGTNVGYIVWKRDTNTTLINVATAADVTDEVHLDKTGAYLVVQRAAGTPQVVITATGANTQLGSYSGGNGFYHSSQGTGTIFAGYGSISGALSYRTALAPTVLTQVGQTFFTMSNMNYDMRADNELWALVWTQRDDTSAVSAPFQQEILQVATDGSARYRRIAHHHSKYGIYLGQDEYYTQPNANISRDGRFVAFTSNMGTPTGARQVYIVRIPSAP